ncbi:unnamed protein product, partial [Effrenium voratum]
EPPEPPRVPRLPPPQPAVRRKDPPLHQPPPPRQVKPPAAAARPVLKPATELAEAPGTLDPASVVAASRLMQEAYTSGTDLGETSEEDELIQRWTPPSEGSWASETSETLLQRAASAASRVAEWLTPAPVQRFSARSCPSGLSG